MPICQSCHQNFPKWIIINGEQRSIKNRKFCLSCVPWESDIARHLVVVMSPEKQLQKEELRIKAKHNGCRGTGKKRKVRYQTIELAEKAKIRMEKEIVGRTFNVYKCECCGKYHIGTDHSKIGKNCII